MTSAGDFYDVVVVGGGVIGLSVAYHAARRGASVALFEADALASGASGAAAGMLNAQAEAQAPGPMLDLMLRSRELHHTLGPELLDATGLDPEYVWSGTLRVACDDAFATALGESFHWQRKRGLAARWLSGDEVRKLDPGVCDGALAGLFLPEDGQVESRRLSRALALAATKNGAELREHVRVTQLLRGVRKERITGVETDSGAVRSGCTVLAGGSASGTLLSPLGVEIPLFPVKGETITLAGVFREPGPNVWDSGCYVVAKRDGRVVVGATERPHETDRRPTLDGVAHLTRAAGRLLPGLSGATFAGAWGGLRPATPDKLPVLGEPEGLEGLLLASGTYRNGILLAPAVGAALAARALGEKEGTQVDLSPFAPGRFSGS
ncbi:glycine oxidase ThiO [Rubrobacter radiotolerans]|uniref:glycine oxidase n=1 Tax=Rubrobacter radiotolerans TaxID=42256 RepID=A0A023X0J4_RUBRA|nr:glycine oxidase ThiO [Rubrobacter radiotolerans]AHY45868.1 glycine oxidase ThiO [Rubrobacter radiotolerans]MDX5893281.1 glycine oxidase ThiO [Rubrobacter radiotolerans]SMC03417.1 glycine oxidase [Rubrobacter radiotolerans DSM 5868]